MSIVETSTKNYAKINGQFEPINAVASGNMKCVTCNTFYSATEI